MALISLWMVMTPNHHSTTQIITNKMHSERNGYPLLAAKKKPIMIGEMSCAQVGGDKGKWIDEIIPTLRASFPLIKCLVWFDINKEAD